MPYSTGFYRFSFLSRINGTDEVAVTDLNMAAASGGAPAAPAVSLAEDAYGEYVDLLTNINNQVASYTRVFGCKVASIGTDGRYAFDPAYYEVASPTAVGTATAIAPQLSIVLSLRSGQTLGKGNYGRMYIPYSGVAGADGRMSDTIAAAIANAGAGFIDSMNALLAGAGPMRARIMSQVTPTPTAKLVVSVGCGRVIDTQRRRRSALAEEYAFAAVAP